MESKDDKSLYIALSELAEKLSVSGSRITQVINKLDLSDKLIKEGTRKLISPEDAELVKEQIGRRHAPLEEDSNYVNSDKASVKHLQLTIKLLKEQLEDVKKDKSQLLNSLNGMTQANIDSMKALNNRDKRIEQLENTQVTPTYSGNVVNDKSDELERLKSENEQLKQFQKEQFSKGWFRRLFS